MKTNIYRFWDKKACKMLAPIDLKDLLSHVILEPFPNSTNYCLLKDHLHDIVFLQDTMFRDRNGKQIFEGDIIKVGKDVCMVSFSKKFGSFTVEKKGWLHSHYFGEAFEANECKVIGDIYRTPNLINK